MDLAAFADAHTGDQPGADLAFAGPASAQLTAFIQSEDHTHSIVASLFWEVFVQSSEYHAIIAGLGLPDSHERRQHIIIRHGSTFSRATRHDLLILDAEYLGEPFSEPVQPHHLDRDANRDYPGVERFPTGDADLLSRVLSEANEAQEFSLIVSRPPETTFTAIAPTPALEVKSTGASPAIASAGVVALDREERRGVTSAAHAFQGAGTEVTVGGQRGTIVTSDPVSDSCFIEVAGIEHPQQTSVTGPMTGMSPRQNEAVSFDGAASGQQTTFVTAWDLGVPFQVTSWNRLRVFTPPVTEQRDSGSSLVANGGLVVGFAFDRTGFHEAIEYSSWIWAEFVYQAHGLH